jgi:serine/threonine-protein kinase RsbW/stage II sporulation protein AB (anti-sigma F factor)
MKRAGSSSPASARRAGKDGRARSTAASDSASASPSGAGESFSQAYPALPESVAIVRAAVVAFATRIGASQATIAAVELAVSEGVTNVVVHAYRDAAEPGVVEVAAAQASGELWVIVADAGLGLRPRPDSPGLGLGLGLIAQVSDGVDLVQPVSGGLELRMRFVVDPTNADPLA